MRRIKQLTMMALMLAISFASCSKYDDTELQNKVADLESRVKTIEDWCKTTNGQIGALKDLVNALEQKDFVTGITPIMEEAKEIGYTITFTKSSPITIMHGKDGAKGENGTNGKDGKDGITPIIGVAKYDADNNYYWTIKIGDAPADWMKDAQDNMIRTTGDKGEQGEAGENGQPGVDGHTPVLSVAEFEGKLYWQIDGEWLLKDMAKIPATGDKGETGATGAQGPQGDAIFMKGGIDTTDPNNVTFTLADGTTKITLPRTGTIKVSFDSYEIFSVLPEYQAILSVNLPAQETYTSVMAKIESAGGTNVDIKTKAAFPWNATILPETDGKTYVKILPPAGAVDGELAILTVSVVGKNGEMASASLTLKVDEGTITPNGNVYEINSAAQLAWLGRKINSGLSDASAIFNLKADLDLSSYMWRPLGAKDDGNHVAFTYTFNGNHFTIKGIKIERNINRHSGFICLSSGVVKDLNLEGDIINRYPGIDPQIGAFTGGIIGANTGSVINCSFKGNVRSYNIYHAGGIVGINQQGLVAGCRYIGSEGAMIRGDVHPDRQAGGGHTGGIAGYNLAVNTNAYILGCYNTGYVYGAGRSGGIVGENFGTAPTYSSNIIGCYNTGDVKSDRKSSEAGGIAGAIGDCAQIYACYNTGNVSHTFPETELGAIIGFNCFPNTNHYDALNTCYWLTGSAPKGYNNMDPSAVIDCIEKSDALMSSQATVDALNQAIAQWNMTNDNKCNYEFVTNGSNFPILKNK